MQRGTTAVVDKNGLGWPGMFLPFRAIHGLFDLLTIEQTMIYDPLYTILPFAFPITCSEINCQSFELHSRRAG